ncbi:response regulator [Methylophilus sp.]|jgi:two-component system cell cycle response regulator DivK|uniref:response regulator n=1 Tax=Methylophilus sp. TaxID=29541 RepID=UPI000D499F6E|nr:response regulator [Methylophilus sp.]PPD10706.1 MAG: response regulator [Methylophilus sp.]
MASILIIEDNPMNMRLAQLILETAGHEVLQAVNAQDGMEIARSQSPAMILMDIQLPGMDGLTATQLLKKDADTRHIKIVALTAFAMKGDEEKMRAAGCDGYIAKPIRYKAFLETIEALL